MATPEIFRIFTDKAFKHCFSSNIMLENALEYVREHPFKAFKKGFIIFDIMALTALIMPSCIKAVDYSFHPEHRIFDCITRDSIAYYKKLPFYRLRDQALDSLSVGQNIHLSHSASSVKPINAEIQYRSETHP
jgi:hypothetical protein